MVLDTQPIADVDIYPFAYGGVTAQPSILTFTPDNWQTAQTVTVSAAQDDDTENEQVIINHGISAAAESAYADADVTIASVTVSVTDDDTDAQPVQPEPENNAPMADAGSDQTVNAGDEVSLDGSGSSDSGRRHPDLRLDADLGHRTYRCLTPAAPPPASPRPTRTPRWSSR